MCYHPSVLTVSIVDSTHYVECLISSCQNVYKYLENTRSTIYNISMSLYNRSEVMTEEMVYVL